MRFSSVGTLRLSVTADDLKTSVFHKVDNFDFPVISLTFPGSLIPHKMGSNVFAGQVLRHSRISSHLEDFIAKSMRTANLLFDMGCTVRELQVSMKKILHRHDACLKFRHISSREVSVMIGFCD